MKYAKNMKPFQKHKPASLPETAMTPIGVQLGAHHHLKTPKTTPVQYLRVGVPNTKHCHERKLKLSPNTMLCHRLREINLFA